VDILLVIENAGGVSEEIAALQAEIPRLMTILATGDFDQDGVSTGPEDFAPVASVQLGVVTTDMGSGSYVVPTCRRSAFGDDGVLRSRSGPIGDGCERFPRFVFFEGGGPPSEEQMREMTCLAGVGTQGCGFEQPLEAALKAVSPHAPTPYTADGYVPPTFFGDTAGHAEGSNRLFVREDSLLVVMLYGVEDDCSVRDQELFNLSAGPYRSTDIGLRCFAHRDEALYSVSRYVDGLIALRRHPSRLVFSVTGGVPVDLLPAAGAAIDWDRLISDDPSLRDERMVERVDPSMPTRMMASCNVPGRGPAYPPVRVLRVAQGLEARGAGVSIGSSCQESLSHLISEIVARLRP